MNNLTMNNNSITKKNLYFKLGKKKYAVALEYVLEVMKLPQLEYPQKLPNNVIGLLKFNNMVINVLDIRFYIDVEITPYSTSNKLLIIKTDESIFGLVADSIENIAEFESSKIERLPFLTELKLIDALYHIDGETISILNMFAIESLLKKRTDSKNIDITTLFPKDDNSKNILQSRSLQLLNKSETSLAQNSFVNDKFISFGLNDSKYCLNISYIKEVTNKINLIPIPCAPPYIQGLMTLRGDFITILNLKKFLNLKLTEYTKKNKIIIINSPEYKLGFLVDEIHEILEIPEELLETSQNHDDTFVSCDIIINDNILMLLNINKILADEKLYIEEN